MFDADNSGSLDSNEMHKMLSSLLSGVTPNESTFFAAMADVDGDGEVIFGELLNCIKESSIIRMDQGNEEEVKLYVLHSSKDSGATYRGGGGGGGGPWEEQDTGP